MCRVGHRGGVGVKQPVGWLVAGPVLPPATARIDRLSSRTITRILGASCCLVRTYPGRTPRPWELLFMAESRPSSTLSFSELGVPAVLVSALADLGITEPFPIQAATLPDSLAGRDVLGRGRTGSGKTYAYVLPVLARLAADPRIRRPKAPRALILAPTRELASQIEASLAPLD